MSYRKQLIVRPGSKVKLSAVDPDYKGTHESHEAAAPEIKRHLEDLTRLQYLLYADGTRSLLIVLQGIDAAGKDGVCRHVLDAMNPQGCRVVGFKQPSKEELAHDFLWRVHAQTPRRGEVVVFNRSHYEDVLVARVHKLVPKDVWSQRYDQINRFEELLAANGTAILKFFLYISKDEQLERFKQRLDDPSRHWKISESDYTERERWRDYIGADEDMLSRCSTRHAPWYVIPANRKWFRNLAVAQIIAETMGEMGMRVPDPSVDIAAIRAKYHRAAREETRTGKAGRKA